MASFTNLHPVSSPSAKKVKCFQRMLVATSGQLPQGIPAAIARAVLNALDTSKIFPELNDRMFDSTVEENCSWNSQTHCELLLQSEAISFRKKYQPD